MARKSVAEKAMVETAAGMPPPNFERALKVIRNDIDPVTEGIAERRGDLSAAWKIIADECKVNKAAARFFRKLKQSSEEQRDDILRSLYGLMKTDGIGISADLVDRMGDDETPKMPVTSLDAARDHLYN